MSEDIDDSHKAAVRQYLDSKEALREIIQESQVRSDGFLSDSPILLSVEKSRVIATAAIAAYEAELVFRHHIRLKLTEQSTKNLDQRGFKF
jgi:hypothetical protein